jgi:hypothetical protein
MALYAKIELPIKFLYSVKHPIFFDQNEAYTMLVQTRQARVFKNIFWSRYIGRKGLGVSKITSEFLEIFFLNKLQWVVLVVKISGLPFPDCGRSDSSNLV